MKEIPKTSQYSVEAGLVFDRLSSMKMGEQVSYQELTTTAGIDVLKCRYVITHARKRLLREEQKVYKPITKFGLTRMDDEQLASSGVETVKKIGRAARKGLRTVMSAEYANLTPAGKTRHTVGAAVLNMFQHGATQSALNKVEGIVAKADTKVLPLKETLQLMAK